jgi:prevent-host-death family protein
MSNQYSLLQAQEQLTKIIQEVENGTPVEITRDDKPVAIVISIDEYNRLLGGNSSFWKSLEKFYQEIDLEEAEISREIFDGVRDKGQGREVIL